MSTVLKNKMDQLKNRNIAREQEDMVENAVPSEVEEITTDELIETNEKMDEFTDADNKVEALDREIDNAQEEAEVMADDIETIENPTDAEVSVASERLYMFKYINGLAEFRLASESANIVYHKDNKEAMKRIATEFRKASKNLEIAREGMVTDKLGDWLYSLFNFGKKRFEQVKRELLKGKLVDNFDKLDEANKILVTKSLYTTVINIAYILKYFGKSNTTVSKDIKGMLKTLKLDVKELSNFIKDIVDKLKEIEKELKASNPITAGLAKANNNEETARKILEAFLQSVKVMSRGKLVQTLIEKNGSELEIIKAAFGETFAKYSLDEFLAQNKGNIDELVRSINLDDAINIEKDIKYIIEDIFDIYDYVWDYIFNVDYSSIDFIWGLLQYADRDVCKTINKFFTIIGNIKQRIHTDIYDAFVTLRKA